MPFAKLRHDKVKFDEVVLWRKHADFLQARDKIGIYQLYERPM